MEKAAYQDQKVKVTALCKLFGISRQGYYKKIQTYCRNKEKKNKIIELVKKQRVMLTRAGTKKTYHLIKPQLVKLDIKCGRDKLNDILRSEGMHIRRKKNYLRTTNSYHRFYKYPNLIKDLNINRPEQVWVSDITYIRTNQGWLYLSLITDAYSKRIVGHQLSDNLKTINCIYALKMAIKNRKYPDRPLIHHSDRGFQYCCPEYTKTLDDNHIDISMTTKHDPYENAVAERVNGTIKNEFDLGGSLPDRKTAEMELNKSVWIYNNLRPHESLYYLTPIQAHNQENIEIKKWPVRFRKKQDQNNVTLNQLCHTQK